MGARALEAWREKLDFLLEQEALATDPTLQFSLRRQIEEAKGRIGELERAQDDFLARVEAVCRLREPEAEVERMAPKGAFGPYLRVTRRSGLITETFPVGAVEHGFQQARLQAFLDEVDADYRRADSGLISYLVYGGGPMAHGLLEEAALRRVHLLSFVEYQGLIDFRAHLEKQTRKLAADPLYPPRLYVPQRMRTVSLHSQEEAAETEDALARVWEWLASPHGRFLVLLGDFGTGKTFLLHELARRMGAAGDGLVPILLQMRSLEKGRSLDALLAQHFAQEGMEGFSPARFRYMLEQGRIALLFDGFDELALRVTYGRATEHFDTLLQAAAGAAKVVLTSRRQHFLSESQVKTALAERVEAVAGHRLAILQTFSRAQVRAFLLNTFQGDEPKAAARLDLIDRVKDLLGLSSNPRLLGFIAELPEADLVAASSGGEITAAKLYEILLEKWLVFEFDRVHPRGAPPGLSVAERWRAVTALALRLWQKTERSVSLAELGEEAARVVEAVGPAALDRDVATFQVGSGTLLVRDDDGHFLFLHQSILEWLVARSAAEDLRAGRDAEALLGREMSPLMVDFFVGLAGEEPAFDWAQRVVAEAPGEEAGKNALLVLGKLGRTVEKALQLARQDLRGKDFSDQDLSRADLRGSDLSVARLIGTRLSSANLKRATLRGADLSRADLTRADLGEADLTRARLFGADLRGARLTRANLRRAKLWGAAFDPARLRDADTFGAVWGSAAALTVEIAAQDTECRAVAWSPDGDLLAAAGGLTVRLLDAGSGREIRTWRGHHATVLSVAWSPDGRLLASGSADRTVRLWEVESGSAAGVLTGHRSRVWCVAWSPDGQTLASSSDDKTVRLWRVPAVREAGILHGHQSRVWCVAWSPDGKTLASGSSDQTAHLWQLGREQPLRVLRHQAWVWSVAFGPSGETLASGCADYAVRLWDVDSGRQTRALLGHRSRVLSVAWSCDGQTVASGSEDRTIRLWEADSGREVRVLEGHQGAVSSVAFSPDRQMLVSGASDQTVQIWHTDTGRVVGVPRNPAPGRAAGVAFSPDGQLVASASSDHAVRLWHATSGQLVRFLSGHRDGVTSVAFSPRGQTVATSSDDGTLRLWRVDSGDEIGVVQLSAAASGLAVSPNGRLLAFASEDRWIGLQQLDEGVWNSGQIARHSAAVSAVAFSPTGRILASGSADRTIRLWRVDSGKEIRAYAGHQDAVQGVAFNPEGTSLASASADHTVRIWPLRAGQPALSCAGHEDAVLCVAWSVDGTTLASGSADRTVRLWQIDHGPAGVLAGHHGAVRGVAFSPYGSFLASASDDGTVRLWEVATGRCLAILLGLAEGWIAFSPDGRYKLGGVPAGGFWHVAKLCRFEAGELDGWIPGLRLADDDSFLDLPVWRPEAPPAR